MKSEPAAAAILLCTTGRCTNVQNDTEGKQLGMETMGKPQPLCKKRLLQRLLLDTTLKETSKVPFSTPPHGPGPVTILLPTHLDARMAAQEEVEVGGVADRTIDHSPRDDVAAAVRHAVRRVQPRVVPLLHHNERHRRLVVGLDVRARFTHCVQLMQQHLRGARREERSGLKNSISGRKAGQI